MPINKWLLPLQALLLISYPLCCHFAVTVNEPRLQLLAISLLCIGLVMRGLLSRSLFSWLLVLGLLATVLAIFWYGSVRYLLYVPPIALPTLLFIVFFRSLLAGQTPLVTAFAQEARGTIPSSLAAYTRTITVLWAALFAVLAIGSAFLAAFASAAVWSLFTNFLSYVAIAALFIVEFIFRQWRFPNLEHSSFWQYLQGVLHSRAARSQ